MIANFPDYFKTIRIFQMIANFPDDFKTVRIFPDDCQFSGWFRNCMDRSRWLPIFRIFSKLSGFFQMTADGNPQCRSLCLANQFLFKGEALPKIPLWKLRKKQLFFLGPITPFCWVKLADFPLRGGGGAWAFITHSLAMSWEAKARFLGLSWDKVSRTSSRKFLHVESCSLEGFGVLRLWEEEKKKKKSIFWNISEKESLSPLKKCSTYCWKSLARILLT